MILKNYTPHSLHFRTDANSEPFLVLPSEGVARCIEVREPIPLFVNGIPLNRLSLGEVYDLPDAEPGVRLIVSRPVAEALKEQRADLFVVDELVRDDSGRVVGCKALATIY